MRCQILHTAQLPCADSAQHVGRLGLPQNEQVLLTDPIAHGLRSQFGSPAYIGLEVNSATSKLLPAIGKRIDIVLVGRGFLQYLNKPGCIDTRFVKERDTKKE